MDVGYILVPLNSILKKFGITGKKKFIKTTFPRHFKYFDIAGVKLKPEKHFGIVF